MEKIAGVSNGGCLLVDCLHPLWVGMACTAKDYWHCKLKAALAES